MRILFFLFLSIHLMGQTPPRVTFKQIQKDTLTGSIAISGIDSNLIYSRDIIIANNKLVVFGDTVGQGSLNAILVDGVTILGDGVSTNLSADTNLIKDIIGAMVNAGLGIDVAYNSVDKELLIESLAIEDLVHNGTGTQIDKGTPLYAVGVQGNYWNVAPADAGDIAKLPVVAIAGENIAAGAEGLALIKGHIKGVNTSSFSAGDEVYVGVGGGYTTLKPKGEGNYVQYLGTVIKADANGSGIINLGEVESNLNPGRIFIGGADSTITRVTLKDSISSVIGDSLSFYVSKTLLNDSLATKGTVNSITAGTFLSGGTITSTGTIALDTASAGLKTYISENGGGGTVDLTSQVTGTLPVANGGTGVSSLDANKVLVGNGTDTVLTPTNLHWDNTNSRLGIGTSSPLSEIHISGKLTIDEKSDPRYTGSISYDIQEGSPPLNKRFIFNVNDSTSFNRFFIQEEDNDYNGVKDLLFLGYPNRDSSNFVFESYRAENFIIQNRNPQSGGGDIVFNTGQVGSPTTLNERMRITRTGNVGIGTTSPVYQLHNYIASGSITTKTESANIGDSESAIITAEAENRLATIGVYKHSGITNNCGFLYVTAEDNEDRYIWSDNSGNLRISSTITHIGTTSGTVVGLQTSDKRLKYDLGEFHYGLNDVMELTPVRFTYKDDQDQSPKIGFYAQDAMSVVPESVYDTKEIINEGEITKLGMDYSVLIPVLTKAIQEQQAIIESQQQEIETLKTQIQNILTEINNLKNN